MRDFDLNNNAGGGGGRSNPGDPRRLFEKMACELMAHVYTLHRELAEDAMSFINALVQAHAELKNENKELRGRIEALEAAAPPLKDGDK